MNIYFKIASIIIFLYGNGFAQLLLNDDFQFQKDQWYWRSDGNQDIPKVNNGLLHLKLVNAIDTEYCNTEIYNKDEIYLPGTQVRMRVKASQAHFGSRGWGFWDGKLDLYSLIFDYDVAWVMQQNSQIPGSEYNWFLFGVDGDTLTRRSTYNLNNIIDETKWHTYKIVWDINKVTLFIDNNFHYEAYTHLPNEKMRVDIWADNRVINLDNPLDQWHTNSNLSEIFVDFVEVSGLNGPAISRVKKGSIVYWESPNTYPDGMKNHLWKTISINSESESEAIIFITGAAEKYPDDDDDIKLIVNGHDYQWDTDYSINGDTLNGNSRSIILPINFSSGVNNIDLITDITPFIKDIIILNKPNGKFIFSNHFNETNTKNNELWKTVDFNLQDEKEITILISGVANIGEGLRFELDNNQYGWDNDNSILGDSLKGSPNTVAISKVLTAGNHKLNIFGKGDAKLLSVAAYSAEEVTNIEKTNLDNNFSLSIYPNPFNNSTKINYSISQTSSIKLNIYNLLGKKVATLIDKTQSAGNYTINWHAKNVSSGIYFCIFESENYTNTQKILLLK